MTRHVARAVALWLTFWSAAWAQQPVRPDPPTAGPPTARPSSVGTPDLDFYVRPMRDDLDAKTAVRRKAEYRARQRMARLAALKWFGMSNARPIASSTPWASMYSPAWVSSSRRPFGWSGATRSPVIIQISPTYMR